MPLRHMNSSDMFSIVIDELNRVTEAGIILSKAEAIEQRQDCRMATVLAVPDGGMYTETRGKKQRLLPMPVKPGDRIMLSRYAGVDTIKEGGQNVSIIRVHEIIAVVEDEEVPQLEI